MCASRLRSDWSCKYYFTVFSVFEEMERWGRQIVTLQRWQIHVCYGGRGAHSSICLIRHQYVTGFVPALLLLCNALPALLDVVVDWGLLQQNSKNPWLRDNLILKRKYLYYISMVLLLLLYTILKSHFLIHNPNPFPLPFQRLKSISKTGPKNHW